jgi:copper chaperone
MTTTTFPEDVTLAIDGMTCGHCLQAVTKVLAGIPGIRLTALDLGVARIGAAGADAIQRASAALEDAGYTARVIAPAGGATPRGGGCCASAQQGGDLSKGNCCC